MEMVKISGKWLQKTVEVIRSGGLVVFPTDTVYILAVDPTNQKAVSKLLAFKNRWVGKAISVAVADPEMAGKYVEFGENEGRIYANLLPGPFTVVSKGKHKLAAGIEAENGTLGVRIPDNKAMAELVGALGGPVTATSANLAGRTPHYSLESFLKTLSDKKRAMIDLLVDGGKLARNKPSTVIDITGGDIEILRRGDLITGKGEGLISKTVRETEKIGGYILTRITKKKPTKPVVLMLTGDLGAGKTVLTRGIGKALLIKDRITSPTFNISNQYEVAGNDFGWEKMVHIDLYRIESEQELMSLKILENLGRDVLTVIEWPEVMGQKYWDKLRARAKCFVIKIEYTNEYGRKISWQ